ncbi:hypothetical protein CEXT_732971 [Caerostris extrusa]|uniref:Uncharacterized protein n=1 Tax=Caerostris extrusa TaxID=172846 RepID=A0AAV4QY62_CAEEX|nr:hypothetical protein CEXT_732971 [Caerostris extrusa]
MSKNTEQIESDTGPTCCARCNHAHKNVALKLTYINATHVHPCTRFPGPTPVGSKREEPLTFKEQCDSHLRKRIWTQCTNTLDSLSNPVLLYYLYTSVIPRQSKCNLLYLEVCEPGAEAPVDAVKLRSLFTQMRPKDPMKKMTSQAMSVNL